jgi:hypothetical protein
MDWILARLKEPSSHAGIAALLGGLIVAFVPPQWQWMAQTVAGIFGFSAIVTKERSSADVGAP